MAKTKFEFSAGGVVIDKNKMLLIRVTNLAGEKVWTLPKGHFEKGESAEETAKREVQEETGYECEIINKLDKTEYFYKKNNKLIKKSVSWFLMKPIKKVGEPDKEVEDIAWIDVKTVKNVLSYDSDKKLLGKI